MEQKIDMGSFVRWVLFLLAVVSLFVGAGGGAGISYAIAKTFEGWQFWMQALPGAGWAVGVALSALWASMDRQRRFLFFPPERKSEEG